MQRLDGDFDLATQAAADRLILGRAAEHEIAAFLDGLPPGRLAGACAALLSRADDAQLRFVGVSPPVLGGWLSARLSARGYAVAFDTRTAMYALADAARMLSVIELLRWLTVVEALAVPPQFDSVRDRLLSQSRALLRTLARLADHKDLRHEHRVLKCLRDRR